jgi:hypothetical protein
VEALSNKGSLVLTAALKGERESCAWCPSAATLLTMAVSPAAHPARPSGLLDFKKPAEYPIVLGDSLKDAASTGDRFMDLRFNWQPKAGFQDYKTRLSTTDRGLKVDVTNKTTHDSAFEYIGHQRQTDVDGQETSSFALILDKQRSVFVLESLTASIDLNLESASSLTKDDIRRRQKLPSTARAATTSSTTSKPTSHDEDPDPDNPYDYRNFIQEAREQLDKAAGSKSPFPGSRTPLSGFASPATGPTRLVSNTTKTPSTAPKEPRSENPATKPRARKPPAADHRATRQPLSSEKVSDSDDEMSDAAATAPAPQQKSTTAANKPPTKPHGGGHTRQASANIGASPHIVVNDGDLEIDMGSPPPEAGRRGRRNRAANIDTHAFRSHTGTPVIGRSPLLTSDRNMPDAPDNDDDDDEDGDVDVLDLGEASTRRDQTRRDQAREREEEEKESAAPTPPQMGVEEDDEVAELEDLLGGDDDADMTGTGTAASGLGLGITGTANRVDDDESDVSEEE